MGKVWYDNLCVWVENRYAVAETFEAKSIVAMVEDEWVTTTGRADLEGMKLFMATEKGRRDVAMG